MITGPQFIGLLTAAVLLGGLILYSISLMRVKVKYTKEQRIEFVRRKYARIFGDAYAQQRVSDQQINPWDWYNAVREAEEEEIQKIMNE